MLYVGAVTKCCVARAANALRRRRNQNVMNALRRRRKQMPCSACNLARDVRSQRRRVFRTSAHQRSGIDWAWYQRQQHIAEHARVLLLLVSVLAYRAHGRVPCRDGLALARCQYKRVHRLASKPVARHDVLDGAYAFVRQDERFKNEHQLLVLMRAARRQCV